MICLVPRTLLISGRVRYSRSGAHGSGWIPGRAEGRPEQANDNFGKCTVSGGPLRGSPKGQCVRNEEAS